MNYTFSGKVKTITLIMMGIGILATIYGFIFTPDRIWSNLLLGTFFFLAVSVGALFFIGVHSIGEAAWHTVIKRIPEAITQYVPVGSIFMLVLVILGFLGINDTWQWMDKSFRESDVLFQNSGKSAWLNTPFFLARTVLYLGGWSYFAWKFRKLSIEQDAGGGLQTFKSNFKLSAVFLVFFAVTSSTSAWDWLMSIDVHWYSTLFGWYVFAGMFVSALITMLLVTVFLKKNGYLPSVNDNHIHDLAKYVFAFSVFWTYLWFSQYLLYWYSNIPEEVNYFLNRFKTDYKSIMILMLVINFAFPVVLLMHRYAKRNYNLLLFVGFILIFGHYLDLFQIIMPGTVANDFGFGFTEIGTFIGFAGVFLYVTLSNLTKASLEPKNHPFVSESKQHQI